MALLDVRGQAGRTTPDAVVHNRVRLPARLRGEGILARRAWRPAYVRRLGCCLPLPAGDRDVFDGLPVLGDLGEVAAELLLAPAVTEVAGPRVRVRPVAGSPLVHVERPESTSVRRIVKEVVDRTAAGLGILLLVPLLATLALLVKVTGRGPAFFRHERIGRDGRPFQVLEFRSTVVDADEVEVDLFGQNQGNAVQFEMRRDPRVTRIGAVMRRYSLDELPQLSTVLGGSTSLVGPRPHVAREVEQYGHDLHRRLLAKPGLTGLWQVRGRSEPVLGRRPARRALRREPVADRRWRDPVEDGGCRSPRLRCVLTCVRNAASPMTWRDHSVAHAEVELRNPLLGEESAQQMAMVRSR